jgi:hypothetical protein
MKPMRVIVMLALGAIACAVEAVEPRFQCPERYVSQPARLAEVPDGWTGAMAIVQPQLLVSGGGMVRGAPALYPPVELHGSEGKKTRDGWSETRFPVEGESWAFCSYGHDGDIRLFRRVDGDAVRECVLRTRRTRSVTAPAVEFVCK